MSRSVLSLDTSLPHHFNIPRVNMGAKHSKGSIRGELQGVLPRSWAELEIYHTRFQQEVFRRRSSDAQCQFFLTFPVFQSVVMLRATPTETQDDWRHKELLLRAFQYLDRKHRRRVAAMDFFAGLALVTNAKKAVKFDFLFSLLDNGGLKVLNSCEVMMIIAAAARGLAMFKAIPAAEEDALRPLARRLMGESSEVTRAHLVEKALTDPEIVFFMNDLENETATTSDALLVQQARLMKSIAANELQLHRVEPATRVTSSSNLSFTKPTALGLKAPQLHRPSAEAMLRRLQAILLPASHQQNGSSEGVRVIQSVAKRVDARSLSRLVQSISDGALSMTKQEADAMLLSLGSDGLGFVRNSDILRVMRSWLFHVSMLSPPLWQSFASATVKQIRMLGAKWSKMVATLGEKSIASKALPLHQHGHGSEINYTFKASIGPVTAPVQPGSLTVPAALQPQDGPADDYAVRIRLRIHHSQQESPGGDEMDGPQNDDDDGMSLIVELGLRSGLSDEDAIDVASAVEKYLNDEDVLAHVQFALASCQATVVDSQVGMNSLHEGPLSRCLRLTFPFTSNIFEDVEHVTRCRLSHLVGGGIISLEFDQSLRQLVDAARGVASLFPQLMKQEEREKLLSDIFLMFDADKDGKWTLQEFNAFQQAIGECALDDPSLFQCFGGLRELTSGDLIRAFQSCSTDEFRILIEKLGRGSLSSQLRGVCSGSVTWDERELKQFEQSLSHLHWGDHTLKKLSFYIRSLTDFSCDFHCRYIAELMQALGFPQSWCGFVQSPTRFVEWLDKIRDFISPKHIDHERDFVCRSLLCSMEEVISKTPQQLELEDQQQSLPQGTSARRAATLRKAHDAMTHFRESVSGLERVAIVSPEICLTSEIDNFNLIDLLR